MEILMLKSSVSILLLGTLASGCTIIENAKALKQKQARFDRLETVFSDADANEAGDQTQKDNSEGTADEDEQGNLGDTIDEALDDASGTFSSSLVADMPPQGIFKMQGGVLFGNDKAPNALLAFLDGEIDFGHDSPTIFGELSEVQQVDLTSSGNFDKVKSAKLFDGVATFETKLDPNSTTLSVKSENFIDRTITYRDVEYSIEFESGGQLYGDGAERWAVGEEDNFSGTLTNTQTGAVVSYDEGKWGMVTPE